MTLEGAVHVPAGRRDRKGLLHAGPPRRGPNRERGGIGQGAGRAQLKARGCCEAVGRVMCLGSRRVSCAGRW